MVPPKPVLTKETKTYLNCRRVSSSSNEVSTDSIQGTSTVVENNIGAPKMRNNYLLIFLIALFLVITLSNIAIAIVDALSRS